MVLRKKQRDRKYFGTRRWGVGNIKNARGAGGRGGVGAIARLRKHDWTYITAKRPDLIRKKGFASRKRERLEEISLRQISEILKKQPNAILEFKNYKVLSNGSLEKAVTIKAAGFSKQALEKIKSAGGQAIKIGEEKGKEMEEAKAPI